MTQATGSKASTAAVLARRAEEKAKAAPLPVYATAQEVISVPALTKAPKTIPQARSRQIKRLTARAVATITKPGRHADGGNLYLTITCMPAGVSKRWTFLYKFNGKQREAGLGSVIAVTLAEAREKAGEYRSLLARGIDPLNAKKAANAAVAARKTFGQCADGLIASKKSEWRNATHAKQWPATIHTYCTPILGRPVDAIDTAAVLSVLQPLWQLFPETASRLRGRIEAVLDYAKAHGLRSGENPAAWRGHLALILPKRGKLARGHHAAMAYSAVPAFVAALRKSESVPAIALEFLILTAARRAEVLGARWNEVDIAARVWSIPGDRMNGGKPHRVPLSACAVQTIERLAEHATNEFVFPGQRGGRHVGVTAMARLCPSGATIHGFRSSFRDWAGEETSYPRELAEQALAHATGNAVEQAYRRGDALEKRRQLMEAWASYCEPSAGENVVPMTRAAKHAVEKARAVARLVNDLRETREAGR